MAFGGTGRGRMSEKMRKHFLRTANRRLPPQENPHGVPRRVMKALAAECLPSNVAVFDLRLQRLLALHELSKAGG
jgi:hypothetical protein